MWRASANGPMRISAASICLVDDDGRVRFTWAERDVALRLRGRHNGWNAMLALALGRLLDSMRTTQRSARPCRAGENAGRIPLLRRTHGNRRLLQLESRQPFGGRRIASRHEPARRPGRGARDDARVGRTERGLHEQAAREVADTDVDVIVATGDFAAAFRGLEGWSPGRVIIEDDPIAAFELLARRLKGDEVVLLKGSRGVRLERLLPLFEKLVAGGGVLHPHGETFGSRASDSFTGNAETRPRRSTPRRGNQASSGGMSARTGMAIGADACSTSCSHRSRRSTFSSISSTTSRSAPPGRRVTALLVAFIFAPPIIRRLRRPQSRAGDPHGGSGQSSGQGGTPTMGGLLIILGDRQRRCSGRGSTAATSLVAIVATLWMGAIGLLDDFLKIVRGKSRGARGALETGGPDLVRARAGSFCCCMAARR